MLNIDFFFQNKNIHLSERKKRFYNYLQLLYTEGIQNGAKDVFQAKNWSAYGSVKFLIARKSNFIVFLNFTERVVISINCPNGGKVT